MSAITPIISKIDEGPGIDHCMLASKAIDRDERVIPQTVISTTSDIDHRNLISLTHSPHMSSPMISSDVDYRGFPGIPMPPSPPAMLMEAVSKPPKDNVESVDMDLSDDDEKPKSNLNEHPVLLPPPPPPPMPFEFEHQSVPDIDSQWKQSTTQWNNEGPSFNENQWNAEQSERWKQTNQWEHEQNQLNFAHNQTPQQWPQNDQRSQPNKDFNPKWVRGNTNWPRGPRSFNQYSRPSGRWNQGPRFGPRNLPW